MNWRNPTDGDWAPGWFLVGMLAGVLVAVILVVLFFVIQYL